MSRQLKTAVILAAGMGSRLGKRTEKMPKGFVKIGEESLIERSIRLLKECGVDNIIIGCGHENSHYQKIRDAHDLSLYYNDDYSTTGSLYTLVLADSEVEDDFLLLESDLLYEPRSLKVLLDTSESDVVLLGGRTHSGDEVYAQSDSGGQLVQLSKDKTQLTEITGELVGISKLSISTLEKLSTYVDANKDWQKMDYEKGLVLFAKEQNVKVKKVEDLIWCEIDNEEHLNRAKTKIYPLLQ